MKGSWPRILDFAIRCAALVVYALLLCYTLYWLAAAAWFCDPRHPTDIMRTLLVSIWITFAKAWYVVIPCLVIVLLDIHRRLRTRPTGTSGHIVKLWIAVVALIIPTLATITRIKSEGPISDAWNLGNGLLRILVAMPLTIASPVSSAIGVLCALSATRDATNRAAAYTLAVVNVLVLLAGVSVIKDLWW